MARQAKQDDVAALGRAQDMIYDAWEAPTVKGRIDLARKALEVSPLCADAYVMLAQHAKPDSDEALELWRGGVDAGKTALGRDFAELAGEFWGFLETRPYMRARFGLARALWTRGARDEAIGHLREMLKLNPNDNQGVRYILAAFLVETGAEAAVAALLSAYRDDASAAWVWTKALVQFRKAGDDTKSRSLLAKALADNPHAPAYLTGERAMPKRLPGMYSPGGEDEAILFVFDYGAGWRETPGALDWLRAQSSAAPPPKIKAKPRNLRH